MTADLPSHLSEAEFREIAAEEDTLYEISRAARVQRRRAKRLLYRFELRPDLLYHRAEPRAAALQADVEDTEGRPDA